MKRILVILAVVVATVVGVVALRTVALRAPDSAAVAPADLSVDRDRAVANLAAALRFRTVNDGSDVANSPEHAALRAWLEAAYPAVHDGLERELVAEHTMLFRWPGRDTTLAPILLMGHTDVVPVEAATEASWPHDPFGGVVADGFLWGRGALDNKQNVIGILEAVEQLLGAGFAPERTLYLVFGHDEESGGAGAAAASALLAARGVRFAFVLDEGGLIADPAMLGTASHVALVKTAEKGYLTLELSVSGVGGHSSSPPRPTPVGILSRALVRLEDRSFPGRLDGAASDLIATVLPERGLAARALVANRWLFEPVLLRILSADPSTNASIRTTVAPTMLSASPKDNVLPSRASAVVNLRLLPGDDVASTIARVRDVIDDERVEVSVRTAVEPSPTSDRTSASFALLERTIRQVAPPGTRVSPYLALGATDSRHFTALSADVYGFTPAIGDADVLARIHGTGERIRIADVERLVRFYVQLIMNAAGH